MDAQELLNTSKDFEKYFLEFSPEVINIFLHLLYKYRCDKTSWLKLFKNSTEYSINSYKQNLYESCSNSPFFCLEIFLDIILPCILNLEGIVLTDRSDNSDIVKYVIRIDSRGLCTDSLTPLEIIFSLDTLWKDLISDFYKKCFLQRTQKNFYQTYFLSENHFVVIPEEYLLF